MKDWQKQKFYRFETAMIKRFLPSSLEDGLGLDESRQLVERICRSYGVSAPAVVKGRADAKKAYYQKLTHKIVLPPWAQRDWVVVHETAHAIVRAKGFDDPGHGESFVRVWMQLWSRMYDIPLSALEQQANLHGIGYTPDRLLA